MFVDCLMCAIDCHMRAIIAVLCVPTVQERDAAVAVANDPARRAAPAGDAMEEDGIPEAVT
jgi:hypothetical protein